MTLTQLRDFKTEVYSKIKARLLRLLELPDDTEVIDNITFSNAAGSVDYTGQISALMQELNTLGDEIAELTNRIALAASNSISVME